MMHRVKLIFCVLPHTTSLLILHYTRHDPPVSIPLYLHLLCRHAEPTYSIMYHPRPTNTRFTSHTSPPCTHTTTLSQPPDQLFSPSPSSPTTYASPPAPLISPNPMTTHHTPHTHHPLGLPMMLPMSRPTLLSFRFGFDFDTLFSPSLPQHPRFDLTNLNIHRRRRSLCSHHTAARPSLDTTPCF